MIAITTSSSISVNAQTSSCHGRAAPERWSGKGSHRREGPAQVPQRLIQPNITLRGLRA